MAAFCVQSMWENEPQKDKTYIKRGNIVYRLYSKTGKKDGYSPVPFVVQFVTSINMLSKEMESKSLKGLVRDL